MNDRRLAARWLASTVTVAAALLWLTRLGDGALSAPPVSPERAASWFEQRDSATTAFALTRVIAMGFGTYLLVVLATGGAARVLHLARATALIDRVTIPFARTVLGGVALLGAMAAPPSLPPHATDAMVELPTDSGSGGQATLHLLPDAPPPVPPAVPDTTTPASPDTTTPIAPPPPDTTTTNTASSTGNETWVVESGESFWSIAQSHLDDVRGGHAGEREVAAYWRRMIELNRSRLATGDPDLLFTGQLIELPTVAVG